MNLEPADRMRLYRDVRTVLVRHYLDLGRMSIQISLNSIHLHGVLVRLPGVAAPLTPEVIQTVMAEIQRVPGVRRVHAHFENWAQADAFGAWAAVEKQKAAPRATDAKTPVYNLETDKAERADGLDADSTAHG